MSRVAAGAAIRALRESRGWSLAELSAVTSVSTMGLSYLERGTRKPQKATVQKVENGLGLPPGSYARLLASADPAAELHDILSATPGAEQGGTGVVVNRHSDAEVLPAHAEAHFETLNALVSRIPAETSNEYETYILSVIAHCVTAELLTASSWRSAVNAGAQSTDRLMASLKDLENIRAALLARLPGSIAARFDRACVSSGMPEAVIGALLGMGGEEIWEIRNRGVVPPGALDRVRAFIEADQR